LLETAYAICRRELSYVYLGNVLTARGQNTLCPQCNKELVERRGYSTRVAGLTGGLCRQCGRKADLLL
jgi:pyruvate formate lyase activating enzyme